MGELARLMVHWRERPKSFHLFFQASTVSSFAWSETQNLMAAIQHDKLRVWYYPSISLIDKELLDLTMQDKDVL